MLSSHSKSHLQHLPELDGIRGVAALMVLCHHLFFTSIPDPERWNWFVLLLSRCSQAGGNGVDLFFVLSGFLITSLLLLDRGGPHFYWNFYWKRTLRILPLYLVTLLLLAIASPDSWRYMLLSLLFVANFTQAFHVASAGPFWTLAIEEQFYLLWPRFAASLSVSKLERLAFALVIVSPILRLIDAAFGHHNFEFTFFHCDGLAFGSILACQRIRKSYGDPQAGRLGGHASSQLLPFFAAIMLTALPFALSVRFGSESRVIFASIALQLSGISLLAYGVIAAAVRHTGSPLLAIFRWRVLTFFGSVSYCLYIANGYMVLLYDHFRGPLQTGNMRQYAIRAAVVFTATLIVCLASRYAIELPALSLRKHLLRRP